MAEPDSHAKAGLQEAAPRAPARYEQGDSINDRYEVIRVLGSGAFSTVYRVHDMVSGEDCAMKVFTANYGIEVVQRELRALMRIHHRNVVRVIDAGQTRTSPALWFIKSELVDGHDLERYTAPDGERLDVERAVELIQQLLAALVVLHPDAERIAHLKALAESEAGLDLDQYYELQDLEERGLVHRDIKPQNLMITDSGTLKLLDFNIASQVGAPVLTTGGTPGYQPPDADLTRWDTSTDLFAVGVVLFELLSGQHPFVGRSPAAGSPPTRLSTLLPAAPAQLDDVLWRACALDRLERFPTARSMSAALAEAIAPPSSMAGDATEPRASRSVPAQPVAEPQLVATDPIAIDEAALDVVGTYASSFLVDPAGTLGETWGITLRPGSGDGTVIARLNAGVQPLLDVVWIDDHLGLDVCVATTQGADEVGHLASRFGGVVRVGFDKRRVPNVLVRFDVLDAGTGFMAEPAAVERITEIAHHVASRKLLNQRWHAPSTTDRLLQRLPPPKRRRDLPPLRLEDVDEASIRACVGSLHSGFTTRDVSDDPRVRSAHDDFAYDETYQDAIAKWLMYNDTSLRIRKTMRTQTTRGAVWERM